MAELLLHPVRLRIVQAYLGDRQLSTSDLRAELPDVPPATLYRQVRTLILGEVLEVVSERRVRGTLERTYRLRRPTPSVTAAEAATMSLPEHRSAFTTFVAALLSDFDRYLGTGQPNPARDGVGYQQSAIYLSAAELPEFLDQMSAALAPWIARPATPGRVRRLLSTVLLPT